MATVNQSQQAWPFNPNFPRAFTFPAIGTVEWLALTFWTYYEGDAAKIQDAERIRAGAQLNWQYIWGKLHSRYSFPTLAGQIPNTEDFSMKHPGGWVETLLGAERFWLVEINIWSLQMVENEFEKINGRPLDDFFLMLDAKQCEHLCCRLHAYQQARYRWHEHLLEKHCPRCFGRARAYPLDEAAQAKACLLGWLSKQRGFAKNPLIRHFRYANREQKGVEWRAFKAESAKPSAPPHPYRNVLNNPSRPDMFGWVILTWPIWSFYKWQLIDVVQAMIEKFDRVDLWPDTFKRFHAELTVERDSLTPEEFLSLAEKHFSNPTPQEVELKDDRESTVRRRRRDDNYKKMLRATIGDWLWEQTPQRPRQNSTANEKPPLWDFALRIHA